MTSERDKATSGDVKKAAKGPITQADRRNENSSQKS
jgi:hypothetical protein